MELQQSFEQLLNSSERNRKKKRKFPDFWLTRGYLEHAAYQLAEKSFLGTLTEEEIQMTKCCTQWKVDFWLIRGHSMSEAVQKVSEAQCANSDRYHSKYTKEERAIFNSTTIDYWLIKTGGDIEEANRLLADRQRTFSLEKCIREHGEVAGYAMWKERQDTWQSTLKQKPQDEIDDINSRKSVSLEKYIEKYGEEDGSRRYSEWRENFKGRFSLPWYIERYGETAGAWLYENQSEKYSYARSDAGYIERHGEIGLEIKRQHKERAIFGGTLDAYIDKHGEGEGVRIWQDKKTSRRKFYSNESIEFFNSFIPQNILDHADCKDTEYFIRCGGNIYFYDFHYKNVIIEYHGAAFHPNPSVLNYEEFANWRNPYDKTITAEVAMEKDAFKRLLAIENGFKFFEIYSNDHQHIKEKIKTLILEALHEETDD